MTTSILFVLGGAILLLGGGELLVRGAASLARALGVSAVLVGLTVVAYGTSAPEFCVSVMAAWRARAGGADMAGLAGICTGNVVGSNILNILLVLGATAVICPLKATADFIRREIPIMIGVSVLLYALVRVRGGVLTRADGLIFLAILGVYTLLAINIARRERQAVAQEYSEHPTLKFRSTALFAAMIVGGIGLLVVGSELFLRGAVAIAEAMHISKAVIGLTLVAVGTSLPELAASLVAAYRKHPDICLGNIVGSNIYNIVGILGSAGALVRLPFDATMISFHLPVMVGAAVLLWPIATWGRQISRGEGLLLLGCYVAYIGWTLMGVAGHGTPPVLE